MRASIVLVLFLWSCAAERTIPFGAPVHLKDGGRAAAGGVRFTVHMLPKLMVSGPVPEIEQAQIECFRGAERDAVLIDTIHKRADCKGVTFELGYADVYHDDVELQVFPATSKDEPAGGAAPRPDVAPSARCAKAGTDELENGVGACSLDADCELSTYQEGCCTQACAPIAKNKADVARARAGERCAAHDAQRRPCPPPSPCSPPTHESIAAVCCAGRCMTARRRLP